MPIQYEKGTYKDNYYRFSKTGIIYLGEWKNQLPHGYGTSYYPNQAYYQGSYLEGVPHGYGRFVSPNGDFYQGSIKYGRANGHGVYVNRELMYRGEFKDNHKHGRGIEKSQGSGGVYFQGVFQYDHKVNGILKYNGNTYEGDFIDDTFQGKGKLTNQKGVYTGTFKRGKQQGYGQFLWHDGSTYRGYFKNGQREGEGEYFNSKNSSIARGYWKDGLLNGNGEYYQPNGSRHRCIWENSKIKSLIQ